MPGHASLSKLNQLLQDAVVQDKDCNERWPKIYGFMLSFKFEDARRQVIRWWENKVISLEGKNSLLQEICEIEAQRPDSIG